MFFIYNLLLVIAIVLFFPLIIFKILSNKNLKIGLKDRLTLYSSDFKNSIKNKKIIWIHSSSVGEVNIAEILVKKLKKNFPSHHILITTMTYTGYINAINKKLFDYITIVPFDTSFLIKRFLKITNPEIVLITETEFWPNIFYQSYKKNIPLIVYNCRISDKSIKNYLKFRFFFSKFLNYCNKFICQNLETVERLKKLGVQEDKIEYSGNIKFDFEYENIDKSEIYKIFGINPENKKFILTCGSTHAPEEEKILSIFNRLKDTILILAPRHVNRIKEIEELIKKFDYLYVKLSEINKNEFEILLIDKIGYLIKAYAISDVCFIGGSLSLTGGHNPIEAIYFKKPVISGKNIFNFYDIYKQLKENNGVILVDNENELLNAIEKIKKDKNFAKKITENGYNVYLKNRGAIEKTIKIITEVLSHYN